MTSRTMLGLLAFITACGTHAPPSESPMPQDTKSVRGTVAYRERIALPADAMVQVQLSDVSRQDAPAAVIAETTFAAAGRQVPIPFELPYQPDRIEDRHSYAVRATIRGEGRLLFTTDAAYNVITNGNTDEVSLMLVSASGAPGPQPEPGGIVGTSWQLEDLGGAGVIDNSMATLEFPESGKVAGRGSCNQFFGSVEITGEAIKFGQVGSTRMACPEAVMNQESKYFQALEGAERFTRSGDELLVYARGLDKPLRFTRTTP